MRCKNPIVPFFPVLFALDRDMGIGLPIVGLVSLRAVELDRVIMLVDEAKKLAAQLDQRQHQESLPYVRRWMDETDRFLEARWNADGRSLKVLGMWIDQETNKVIAGLEKRGRATIRLYQEHDCTGNTQSHLKRREALRLQGLVSADGCVPMQSEVEIEAEREKRELAEEKARKLYEDNDDAGDDRAPDANDYGFGPGQIMGMEVDD